MAVDYRKKEKQMFKLYGQQKYSEAYSIIEDLMKEFPDKKGKLYNYAYCTQNLMGNKEKALKLMEEAADHGYWTSPDQLMEDEDLKSIREDPRFLKVVGRYREIEKSYNDKLKPELSVLEPEGSSHGEDEPAPLIIALHGNTQNAQDATEDWKFMARKGWRVALPQSSQATMPGAFVWNDVSRSKEELLEHYEYLKGKYGIDPDRVLIAGFSMGAGLAADVCINNVIPCNGFILMGPYMPEPSKLEDSMEEFSRKNGRGYIVIGEEDSECIGIAKEIYRMCGKHNIECRMDIIPGIAHEFPDNFAELVLKNLDFLNK